MKQLTSRSPCLTFTHSRCRGDFSSRALAQSCAEAVTPASVAAASTPTIKFRYIRSRFWSRGLFPLTPALSPGERGNRRQSAGKSAAARTSERWARGLPLPRGEGRGEGEGGVRQPVGRDGSELRCQGTKTQTI